MKKKILGFGLILILMMVPLCGCDDTLSEEDTEVEDAEDASGQASHAKGIDVVPASVGNDARSATIMIYMNGSDLETKAGQATADISEMIDSGIGDNVNVIIQTMGTKQWHNYGISSETSQIYRIKNGRLDLLEDDLGQLDCTVSKTLSDFIKYGKKNFPADRYLLIFWDHGGGPVYGFGYDEWQDEYSSLTLDEIQEALRENSDVNFDIIGMDCCIMANLETCYVLAPFCKYSVLSEDFESGLGWSYSEWMKLFEQNPGMSTPLIGKKIIDEMIGANEDSIDEGGSSTMVLVNERAVPDLLDKWIAFAYKNADKLLGSNYSKLHRAIGRGFMEDFFGYWEDDGSYVTMEDYYVSDMMSIVESISEGATSADDLKSSLKACVAYFGHTSDKNELTGLAVSLPYGDQDFYDKLADVYTKCGIDKSYIRWLAGFVDAIGSDDYCDYSEFEDSWSGWGTYEEGWNGCETGVDSEEWEYDYEEKLWYYIEDGELYLYDDETDTLMFYDQDADEFYYYDEEDDNWYIMEE